MNVNEEKLIKQIQMGNNDAFERLIIDHEKKVYNISYQILKNEEDAKDASQEAFIKVYKSIGKFNMQSSFSTWLYRITVNTCYDFIKKRKSKKEMANVTVSDEDKEYIIYNEKVVNYDGVEENIIKKEEVKALYNAIDELKIDYKTLIVLRDIQGFSYKEIEDMTSLKQGTIKSRISRARNKLKQILSNSELFRNKDV